MGDGMSDGEMSDGLDMRVGQKLALLE